MKKRNLISILFTLIVSVLLVSCEKDDPQPLLQQGTPVDSVIVDTTDTIVNIEPPYVEPMVFKIDTSDFGDGIAITTSIISGAPAGKDASYTSIYRQVMFNPFNDTISYDFKDTIVTVMLPDNSTYTYYDVSYIQYRTYTFLDDGTKTNYYTKATRIMNDSITITWYSGPSYDLEGLNETAFSYCWIVNEEQQVIENYWEDGVQVNSPTEEDLENAYNIIGDWKRNQSPIIIK